MHLTAWLVKMAVSAFCGLLREIGNMTARTATPSLGFSRCIRDLVLALVAGACLSAIAPNLFVTDGACMPSGGRQNPSLTYMALSARAANHAADLVRDGIL